MASLADLISPVAVMPGKFPGGSASDTSCGSGNNCSSVVESHKQSSYVLGSSLNIPQKRKNINNMKLRIYCNFTLYKEVRIKLF